MAARASVHAHADLVRSLGADHPLARAQHAVDVATHLAIEASAVLAAAPCVILVSRRHGVAAAASAALAAAAFWGVVALLRTCRRQRVHDLILTGAAPALPLIQLESRRLVDPARRAAVAGALEAALYEGLHWHEYLPASRPPPGVRHLPPNDRLVHEVTSCLRDGPVTPRAMVLLDRLIQGGYGAAVYQGGPEWVRRELGRIRFELAEAAWREHADGHHARRGATPAGAV